MPRHTLKDKSGQVFKMPRIEGSPETFANEVKGSHLDPKTTLMLTVTTPAITSHGKGKGKGI
jgi:hypothetical protein